MIEVVPDHLLDALAATAPNTTPRRQASTNGHASQFDIDGWLARHLPDARDPVEWNGGRKWILPVCPFNSDHTNLSAFVIQQQSGALVFGCQHNGCTGKGWRELRAMLDPPRIHDTVGRIDERDHEISDPSIAPVDAGDLIAGNPYLNEPIIEGLLRREETMNIIAAPKMGKSWLAYGLALSVVTGASWLDRFACRPGRVLLIDNELHEPTLAHRLQTVADALSLRQSDYVDALRILPLRGRLHDLNGIARLLETIEPGEYDLVVLDAFYRALPPGCSENDNATVATLYNTIDATARSLGCAWVNIHHASKGSQADKSVTDVGSGAGAQSRAADAHLILRPHEEDGVVVLEAAVRSFKPVDPVPLRWQFPVWLADNSLDPNQLRGRLNKGEERQLDKDKAGKDKLLAALLKGPQTVRVLRGVIGAGKDRVERLLDALEAADAVAWEEVTERGGARRIYRRKESGL